MSKLYHHIHQTNIVKCFYLQMKLFPVLCLHESALLPLGAVFVDFESLWIVDFDIL